jgi:hypothetical protein
MELKPSEPVILSCSHSSLISLLTILNQTLNSSKHGSYEVQHQWYALKFGSKNSNVTLSKILYLKTSPAITLQKVYLSTAWLELSTKPLSN